MAAAVVRVEEATHEPADRLLREALGKAQLTPADAALAARFVFSWFRWRHLASGPSEEARLYRALEIAERYAREPERFSDATLLDAALPRWVRNHMAASPALVRALQCEPVLWLRARPGGASALAAELTSAHAGLRATLPDAVRYTGSADLFLTPAFGAGRFEIQDIASQAVGVVCAPQPGETWWDVCAGEGGKTLHLADLMQNRGEIWATDRLPRRLETLRRRAARAQLFNYRVATGDGSKPPLRRPVDGVLLDAPCSGIGTWQRNPHARWTTTADDVRELAAVQSRLLQDTSQAVSIGGRLVYSVCTLTQDETFAVADAFTRAHPEFAPQPFVDPFAPTGSPVASVRWEPQVTGGNGMFVAMWRRLPAQ